MQHTVQKLENGQLFVESLQTTKKYGPKGKVLTVTSKENALKILSENELVGVRGGMMSNRKLSVQLSVIGRFAASHTVYTDAVIISPLEGLKVERINGFKYPNQVKHAVKLVYRSKKGGMITTARIKEGELYITETNGVCKAHYNGQVVEF